MNILTGTSRVLGLTAVACLLSWTPAAPVHAQQELADDEFIEEIVTTGSRIRRNDFSSASPITVVGGQDVLESGMSNLGEALREQAQLSSGGFNQSSILSGGGATAIDLRNLGRNRVLILINGRRVASFADALANTSADLTFVPTAMVERVEILRDGASAVYGSDAITGVVNVILKKEFEGVEASLNTGATSEGDGETYGVSMTMGVGNDRGSLIAGTEYRRQDPVKQIDRDWSFPNVSALNSNGAFNGSPFSPGGLFLGSTSITCTVPQTLGGDETTLLGFDDTSNPLTCPGLDFFGIVPPQNVSSPDEVQMVNYDYGVNQDLIIESEVITFSAYGTYQLNNSTNLFLESQYSKRMGFSHLDGNPGSFGTPAYPAGTIVPASNPNNPTGETGTFLIRPTTTIGPRTSEYESNTLRIVTGIEGDLPIGNDWIYEASFLYTRVDTNLATNSVWNLGRMLRISDPDLCAADSLCSSVVNPSGALDTLRPGNWTDNEIQYMRQVSQSVSNFDTIGGLAFVSGPAFELPAGSVNVALGIETRRETGYNKPDSITEAGESVANQVFTTQGAIEVDEVFAELDIPLLNDVTAFQDLNLNLQWRYSDYDIFGSEDVYRVGLDWRINDWIRLRGNVSTAYRAPTVTDLFGGGTVSFDSINDICDSAQSGIVPTDNAWQNCVLDGLDPATFTQPTAQYSVLSGSNPALTPETADTTTYGLVFTPGGFLEGLQISIDAWDIEVEELIARNTSGSVLTNCYEGPVGLTADECDSFDGRNPFNGTPLNFVNRLENLSNVETNGYDISVNYAFDAGVTSWNLSLNGTYVDENTFFPFAGGADDRGSIPDQVGNLRTDMFWNNFTFSWLVRYIGAMDDPSYDGTNVFGYSGTSSYDKHDIRIAYDWDRYRLAFGINNVLDEDPPYVFNNGANTDTFLYDVMGQYWFARLTFSM